MSWAWTGTSPEWDGYPTALTFYDPTRPGNDPLGTSSVLEALMPYPGTPPPTKKPPSSGAGGILFHTNLDSANLAQAFLLYKVPASAMTLKRTAAGIKYRSVDLSQATPLVGQAPAPTATGLEYGVVLGTWNPVTGVPLVLSTPVSVGVEPTPQGCPNTGAWGDAATDGALLIYIDASGRWYAASTEGTDTTPIVPPQWMMTAWGPIMGASGGRDGPPGVWTQRRPPACPYSRCPPPPRYTSSEFWLPITDAFGPTKKTCIQPSPSAITSDCIQEMAAYCQLSGGYDPTGSHEPCETWNQYMLDGASQDAIKNVLGGLVTATSLVPAGATAPPSVSPYASHNGLWQWLQQFCAQDPPASSTDATCEFALSTLCGTNVTRSMLTNPSNPTAARDLQNLCGCYMDSGQYPYASLGIAQKGCDPVCQMDTVDPDPAAQCENNTTCVMDNVTVNVIHSTTGNITISELCGEGEGTGCDAGTGCYSACYFMDDSVNVIGSHTGKIDISGTCVDCYTIPKGGSGSDAQLVDCSTLKPATGCPAGQGIVTQGGPCVDCPGGEYSAPGSATCAPCPKGQAPNAGQSGCQTGQGPTCAPGQGVPSGAQRCAPCPAGTVSGGGEGATCQACPPGEVPNGPQTGCDSTVSPGGPTGGGGGGGGGASPPWYKQGWVKYAAMGGGAVVLLLLLLLLVA